MGTWIGEAERELRDIFRTSTTKHEANRRAEPVLVQLSREPKLLSEIIERYLVTPGALDRKNYPVVAMNVALNPYFQLVANCWIPLPGRETDLSTKAIHHHGDLLLSTVTLFGPGYEHWMFSTPKAIAGRQGLFAMELLEAAPHPVHHVSFVDAWIAHTPLYPSSLSITLALWSSRFPTTWRDRVKRLPIFRGREQTLRKVALRLGLKKRLELKTIESFDYFPTEHGFQVIPERKEFDLGPNEDHVASVFHVVQQTGNEHLVRRVRRLVEEGRVGASRPHVERFASMVERGTPVEGRLSTGHYGLEQANFTRDDIRRALRGSKPTTNTNGESNGGKFASEALGEAPARASSQ
jgi:hypothetical protein